MAIVFFWKPFFYIDEAAKSRQSGERAKALYPDERLKDRTDLSGISWALGAQYVATTHSGLFLFCSGLRSQAKDSISNISSFYTMMMPQTSAFMSFRPERTHLTVLSVHLQTDQSRLAAQYNCGRWKQKQTQIRADHINTKTPLGPQFKLLRQEMNSSSAAVCSTSIPCHSKPIQTARQLCYFLLFQWWPG